MDRTLDQLIVELEWDIWSSLLAQHNAYGLAKIIDRLDSYRVYDSKYPRDKYAKMVSLDSALEPGGPVVQVADEGPDPSEVVQSQQLVAEYRRSLTKRQRVIIDMLADGYSQPEIAEHLGYRGTGVIRYQKHLAKVKWLVLSQR